VLEEEQAAVRLEDTRDLGERRLLVVDAAQDEGHDRGVKGRVRERQALGRGFDDLGRPAERRETPAETTAHVPVGLGEHQPRDLFGFREAG
jgi:hypothetical protein